MKRCILFCSVLFLIACNSNTQKPTSSDQDKPSITSPVAKQKQEVKPNAVLEDEALKTHDVLSGKATIMLPSTFQSMSEDMLRAKYPNENNLPSEAFASMDGSINLILNTTKFDASPEKLGDYKKVFTQQFRRPEIEFIESKMVESHGKKAFTIAFISPAVDSKIYNYMYITDYKGKLVMCSFNCLAEQRGEWAEKGKLIFASLKFK